MLSPWICASAFSYLPLQMIKFRFLLTFNQKKGGWHICVSVLLFIPHSMIFFSAKKFWPRLRIFDWLKNFWVQIFFESLRLIIMRLLTQSKISEFQNFLNVPNFEIGLNQKFLNPNIFWICQIENFWFSQCKDFWAQIFFGSLRFRFLKNPNISESKYGDIIL